MNQPVTWGSPPVERADAARNRRLLLVTAREIIAAHGAGQLTMDGLAERAGLGKGTVFRRFGTRAGIFQALLDDDERDFQQQVLAGPPPLGPGAPPLDRLIAYGRARIDFLIGHRDIARAALDGRDQVPAGSQSPMSREHIRFLLGEIGLGLADLDVLATQLTAALDGPLLLYLSSAILSQAAAQVSERLGRGWQDLIQRVCRSPSEAQQQLQALDEFLAAYEAEHGEITEEEMRDAARRARERAIVVRGTPEQRSPGSAQHGRGTA